MTQSLVPINVALLHFTDSVIVESAYLDDAQFAAHCDAMDIQCDEAKDGSCVVRHKVGLWLDADISSNPDIRTGVIVSPEVIERRESLTLLVDRVLRQHGVSIDKLGASVVDALISGGI
jgi:hypothetical protein